MMISVSFHVTFWTGLSGLIRDEAYHLARAGALRLRVLVGMCTNTFLSVSFSNVLTLLPFQYIVFSLKKKILEKVHIHHIEICSGKNLWIYSMFTFAQSRSRKPLSFGGKLPC